MEITSPKSTGLASRLDSQAVFLLYYSFEAEVLLLQETRVLLLQPLID